MQLTSNSHLSFNISINGKLAFQNENIHFTTRFVKCWNDPEFYAQLEQMDVCSFIQINEISMAIVSIPNK